MTQTYENALYSLSETVKNAKKAETTGQLYDLCYDIIREARYIQYIINEDFADDKGEVNYGAKL